MDGKQERVGAALWKEIDLKAANAEFAIKCATCELLCARGTKNSIKTRLKQHYYFICEPKQYKLSINSFLAEM